MLFSVKSIFKILLGVTLITVIGSLIVEIFNTTTTSHFVRSAMDTSVSSACQYFSQESYKIDGDARGNLPPVVGVNGGRVSGTFYQGGSEEGIFNNLYRNSHEFEDFANAHKSTWPYLDEFFNGGNELLQDNKITPTNMGITYLDRDTVERMAKWNLTKLLSNGYQENIRGTGSNLYVNCKGFQVYTNKLRITNIDYTEIGMDDFRFKQLTNLNVYDLGVDMSNTESSTICVADVSYTVPVSYSGITPLGQLTHFVSNGRVDGLNTSPDTSDLGMTFDDSPISFGNATAGDAPVTGEITYYIIR